MKDIDWIAWQKQVIREEHVKDGAANDKESNETYSTHNGQ